MQPLLVATRNRHKSREIAAMLGAGYAVTDLSAYPDLPEIEETGSTFEENAILKAEATLRFLTERNVTALPSLPSLPLVMADDSGLEVDALDGAPGVRSARYSGEGATDEKNLHLLLKNLADQPSASRTARFRCVIAIARPGKPTLTFNGTCEGTLALAPRGNDGFGYDPIFVPVENNPTHRTFAEMPAEEKNAISHRARACSRIEKDGWNDRF